MTVTMNQLQHKTDQYEELLAEACEQIELLDDHRDEGKECISMAKAYLADGKHFRQQGDDITALAAFSYGHGWLDAGIRIGVLSGPECGDLFAN